MKSNSDDNSLQELKGSGFEISEGEADIIKWKVKDANGNTLGFVEDVIFDTDTRKVVYTILNLKGNVFDLKTRSVLIPIGLAEIDAEDDHLILPTVTTAQISSLPKYSRGNFGRNMEGSIRNIFSSQTETENPAADEGRNFYNHEYYNSNNLYNRRNRTTGGETRQTGHSVIGFFKRREHAQLAVKDLDHAGFAREQIDVRENSNDSGEENTNRSDRTGESMSNFFSKAFGSSDDGGNRFDQFATSNTVVAVHVQFREEAEKAADILDRNGAIDIESSEAGIRDASTDLAGSTHPNTDHVTSTPKSFRSKIIETPGASRASETKAIQGTSYSSDNAQSLGAFKEGTIEFTEWTQVPIVDKEARVVEEVNLDKSTEEKEEKIRENVRHTEVDVERFNRKEDSPGSSSSHI